MIMNPSMQVVMSHQYSRRIERALRSEDHLASLRPVDDHCFPSPADDNSASVVLSNSSWSSALCRSL